MKSLKINTVRRGFLLSLVALATLSFSGIAAARSVGAISGYVEVADAGCLRYSGVTSLRNYCGAGDARGTIVPLSVDSSGGKSVTVNGSGTFGCRSYSTDKTGAIVQMSGWIVSGGGGAADMALSSVSVPSGGTLDLFCIVESGGQLNGVRW